MWGGCSGRIIFRAEGTSCPRVSRWHVGRSLRGARGGTIGLLRGGDGRGCGGKGKTRMGRKKGMEKKLVHLAMRHSGCRGGGGLVLRDESPRA